MNSRESLIQNRSFFIIGLQLGQIMGAFTHIIFVDSMTLFIILKQIFSILSSLLLQIGKFLLNNQRSMKIQQKTPKNNHTLDSFLNKNSGHHSDKPTKQIPNSNLTQKPHLLSDYHPSSRQGDSNQTQRIHSPTLKKQNSPKQICEQMIMIGPFDVDYFESTQKKLRILLDSYSKEKAIQYISENAQFFRVNYLKNLETIDDEWFWNVTVPKMLQYASNEDLQENISSCIQMLLPLQPTTIKINRQQIMMILINMFFSTLPKQTHRSQITFAYLMEQKEGEDLMKRKIRLQKLKCICEYFNKIVQIDLSELSKEFVEIQRVNNRLDVRKQIREVKYGLRDVNILSGIIEDRVGYDIMVDFANKKIGGGVLKNGAVQEQILFVKFTQLIVTIPIVYEIEDSEALIIYHPKQWAQTKGYSETFSFVPTSPSSEIDKQSPMLFNIFVAIDAIDFSKIVTKGSSQFATNKIQRQIMKAYVGFDGVQYGASEGLSICTGRWGCGAFRGNIFLKFLIQWIAASMTGRDINYMSQDEQEQKQLKILVNFIKYLELNTSQLLGALLQYQKYLKEDQHLDFLQYIKKALV